MAFGIEHPEALLLLVVVLAALIWALKHKKRGALFHPWAEHLRARIGGGSVYSRFPFFAQVLATVCMVLVIAALWTGYMEQKKAESSRMVGLVIDASGSMYSEWSGKPIERARIVAQKLIEKRPHDRLGVIFFAGEANYTAFGVPASYLTQEEVDRRAKNLGGATIATHGLFTAFTAIAREDELLSDAELAEIFNRIILEEVQYRKESAESQRARFGQYLDALLETKQFKTADRLLIFISDCDLQYASYDVPSVMSLFTTFGIRIELVCLGNMDIEAYAKNSYGKNDQYFLDGVKATGGGVRRVSSQVFDDPKLFERELENILEEIDALKPREITYTEEPQEKFLTYELLLLALALLMLAEVLAYMRRFRINA